MKQLRWQIVIVVLALAAIAVLVLTQQAEQPPQVTNGPEIIGPQPVVGGVYTEALIGEPGRLNPVLDFYNPVDRDVNRLIYSSLVQFEADGLPETDLAESWGISQDGTVYNFSLKTDAVWHDGEPVTSEDVVFTVELLRSDALPVPDDLRQFWINVEVSALDTHLVQFRLPEPFAPFLDYVTFGILPFHLLGEIDVDALPEADFNLEPVGSGPYRFDGWLVDGGEISGVILTAFEDFYDDRAFIDQFIFRYYDSAAEALAAYEADEVMGLSQVPQDVLADALEEPDLNLYTSRLPKITMVLLNLDRQSAPYFQELEVRRALLMSVNRQRLIDLLLMGQGILADTPIFPGTWAHYEGIDRTDFNPEAAESLLRNAGYTFPAEGGPTRQREQVPLSFTMLHPDDPFMALVAQYIQQSWARVGVSVQLEPVDYENLVDDRLVTGNYEAALVDLSLFRSPDPDPYPFWHQTQIGTGQNYSRWDDRSASEYLEQARLTDNLVERIRLYRNFQVLFNRELPALLLYYPVYTYGVDAQVEGLTLGPLYDLSDRLAGAPTWFLLEGGPTLAPTPTQAPEE
ncbi:MAG TPA: ABC transporter substrate-binding protein [Anaerolineales bacterium]|nr:ABC transporter substrate-binding protein [Anaerolineales bacterium]